MQAIETRVEQPVEEQVFFSTSGNLTFYAGKPKRVVQDGMAQTIDPPQVQFRPYGDNIGRLATSEPEIIDAIHARRRSFERSGMKPDVMTAAEYNEASISDEKRLQMLKDSNEKLAKDRDEAIRQIQSKNTLIDQLQKRLEKAEGKGDKS